MPVHPTSIVEDGARIADDAVIGPFCYLSSGTVIGPRTEVRSHLVTQGRVEIGADCQISSHVMLGGAPQITNYQDGDTLLVIGDRTIIREHCAMHRGSTRQDGITRVGSDCYFMDATHVAHDCIVGDRVVFARGAIIGGHTHVEDGVYLGGSAAVHQWCRIGTYAFIGGLSLIQRDIVPYALAQGNPARIQGLNITGFKRRGMPREEIKELTGAFDTLFDEDWAPFAQRLEEVAQDYGDNPHVAEILRFIKADSKRGLSRGTV
jgi:UDP-N-acetylglucosamine acyltransferase